MNFKLAALQDWNILLQNEVQKLVTTIFIFLFLY